MVKNPDQNQVLELITRQLKQGCLYTQIWLQYLLNQLEQSVIRTVGK